MITIENKEGVKYGTTVNMVTVICCACAVPFSMPDRLKSELQDSQRTFYCPNGHAQSYTESTETRLRRQLEKQKREQDLEAEKLRGESAVWINRWQESVEENRKVSRKLKQTEKRMANGTCACCERTFTNMQEHMESVHPDFVKSNLNKPLPLKSKRK